jgi:hypothetical protein
MTNSTDAHASTGTTFMTNCVRIASVSIVVLWATAISSCAVNPARVIQVGGTPGPETPAQYEVERQNFIGIQTERQLRNDPQGRQRAFDRWTMIGFSLGVVGGIIAATIDDQKVVKNVSGATSALSGGIAGWVGYKHFERTIPDDEACQKAVRDILAAFRVKYPPGGTPSTSAEWQAYRAYMTQEDSTAGAACKR